MAERDLRDINENISKIQEAIFSRLGQIDNQYEEALMRTEQSIVYNRMDTIKLDSQREPKLCDVSSIKGSEYNSQKMRPTKKSPIEEMSPMYGSIGQRGKSPQLNMSNQQSAANTERFMVDNLNYFIDQFTNLHAVCNRVLEIDDCAEELQLVFNVLSQDLQKIQQQAGQENVSEKFFSPARENATHMQDISNSNIDQVIEEQRHRQLINFAKRILFCVMHKQKMIENLERINELILEDKREDLRKRQECLSSRRQLSSRVLSDI